ncbi:E3 ubiquitin-protein ligase rnf152 [Scyliorhinus canicula]|uniref:E3 ubiquitin-protein ligase rnf152 n=1 Tax=Scyliorhinus canicula TaxID=7830 RepID=UPI0018F3F2AD|nr:E3 ubiquitin-protein ligase rnf152 [Scyliorhinus canicula]
METVSQDSQMECQICFNYYSPCRRPKQLDCKHTCCSVCLQQMRSSQKELMCPWCRSVTQLSPSLSVSQLPDDPEIITVVSIPHASDRTPVFIRLPSSGCYMVPLTVTKDNALLPGEGGCQLLPGNQRKTVTAVLIPRDQQLHRQHQPHNGPRDEEEEEEGREGVKTSTCSGVCTVLLVACVLLFLLGIVLHNMSCISKRFTAISCG